MARWRTESVREEGGVSERERGRSLTGGGGAGRRGGDGRGFGDGFLGQFQCFKGTRLIVIMRRKEGENHSRNLWREREREMHCEVCGDDIKVVLVRS
jgi:hypothetical protein